MERENKIEARQSQEIGRLFEALDKLLRSLFYGKVEERNSSGVDKQIFLRVGELLNLQVTKEEILQFFERKYGATESGRYSEKLEQAFKKNN